MKQPRKFAYVALVFSLLAITAGVAQAMTESVNIEPTRGYEETIQLADGDHVSLTFRVQGQPPNVLHFFVVLPNGTTVDYGAKNEDSLTFSTNAEGNCTLRFINEISAAQLLTLDYNIERYILGIPILLFVLAAIAVLLAFVVAGYIVMGKYG
jgi:hypothetical protein